MIISIENANSDIRISPKFIADQLPTIKKTKAIKLPILQKPQQITNIEPVKLNKKRKDEFYLLIPRSVLPLLKQIETNPPAIPGFKISHLKELIHLISCRIEDDGFSYLKKEYLRRIISRVDHYITFLKSQGIIEQTKFFQRDFKSYGYRFTEGHRGKYIKIPLRDPRMLLKIRRLYAELNKKNNQYPTQCRLIETLTIDPEAESFAEYTYQGEDLNYALGAINNIQNGEFFHTVDDTGKRFHSNITNLPKELRRFIRVNGKPLIANVDVKNSQPYFSIMILTCPGKVSMFAKSRKLSILLKSLHIPDNVDIKHYKNLVVTGELYEYLWDEFYKRGLKYHDKTNGHWLTFPDRESTKDKAVYNRIRKAVKGIVYTILFDCNRKTPSQAKAVFNELFPTVNEIFTQVRGSEKGNRFENYKRFSILLQNLESYVILKVILKRVYKENHTALTVHDSQLVTNNPERIAEIMSNELQKFVGFRPILSIEGIGKGNRGKGK